MADDGLIHYSDFIREDGSIDALISKLNELNSTFGTIVGKIKTEAKELQDSIKGISGSSAAGRTQLAAAAEKAGEYSNVNNQLKGSIAKVSQQIKELQDKLVSANGASQKHVDSLNAIGKSYDGILSDTKALITSWDELSTKEKRNIDNIRAMASGTQDLRSRLAILSQEINTTVKEVNALRSAEERLKFLQSDEGKELIRLQQEYKAQAAEMQRLYNEEQKLIEAQAKLDFQLSDQGKQLAQLQVQTKQAAEQARLLAQANLAAAGSYDQIKAKYQLAKMELNAMSSVDRQSTAGQTLQADVNKYRTQMLEMEASEQAAIKLQQAYNALSLSFSDTGTKIVRLQQLIRENNATSQQQIQEALSLEGSYNKLKAKYDQLVTSYKAMSEAERNTATGQALAKNIQDLSTQLNNLDGKIRSNVTQLTELQKAEQKLIFLQSAEGQKLVETQEKIRQLTNSYREQLNTVDQVAQAQERLRAAREKLRAAESGNYKTSDDAKLKSLQLQEKETQRLADLQIKLNHAKIGSYNALAAQYEINKIKLAAMSAEMRNATDVGKKLEVETLAIYKQMIHLQEATGNYRLSVGNYRTQWNGLHNSVQQVVRELPAAAVSLNTFFLGISNNIPILIDEIQRVKEKNEMLRREGRPTVSMAKTIASALFGWQSALVILLAVMSKWGKQIIDSIKKGLMFRTSLISTQKALGNVTKELEKTNGSYGELRYTVQKLSIEWKNLKTTAEKTQWIKDNEAEFKKLDISINNVNDAENAFVDNTEAIVNSLRHRAKAAAAQKLAQDKYAESLQRMAEAEKKEQDKPSIWNKIIGAAAAAQVAGAGKMYDSQKITQAQHNREVQYLKDEAKTLEEIADRYFEIGIAAKKAAEEELKAAGIDTYHKNDRTKRTSSGRQPRDLTDTINKNHIKAEKQYEDSVTKLIDDEFAKRRKATADQVQNENNKLREMLRKNEEYVVNVDGKYKKLTDEQKKQIAQQNKWITDTIANNLKILAKQLEQIQKEQQIASLKIRREAMSNIDMFTAQTDAENKTVITPDITISNRAKDLEASLVEERKLMEQNLEIEYDLIIQSNRKLIKANDEHARDEEEIIIELNKKRVELWAEYDKIILSNRARDIAAQLELVQKGSDEELKLLLKQNEIARQLALANNAKKSAAEQQNTADINKSFSKKATTITGNFELAGFQEAQKLAAETFNLVKHSTEVSNKFQLEQERDLWNKKIALAKSGGLNWSQAQTDAAEEAVKGINNEIKEISNFINITANRGLGGALLVEMGFNDEQIEAMNEFTDVVIENIQAILDAEVEAAEKAVELAEERVEAAQKAYDAEIEARNNGYANNVATTKKELQQEKKKQQEKEKLLAAAQKRQEAINSLIQASSLITASANIWSSMSSIPIVGPALAIAMIATMWGSFAAAKIKAKQTTALSDEYGEGGLEFLEGGSHASGNDIDLATKNSKGRNMRAEGGEALAIINKRNTRKYRKLLPDLIGSLNKGTFENKYLDAFANGDKLNIALKSDSRIDLSKIENDVQSIRKQNETKQYLLPDGSIVIQHKNVKRIIRH